jgi:hypothetical protein
VAVFFLYKNNAMSGFVGMLPISDQNIFQNLVLSRIPLGTSPIKYRDGYAIIANDSDAMTTFLQGQKKSVTLIKGTQLSLYLDLAAFGDKIQESVRSMLMPSQGAEARITSSLLKFYADLLTEMRGISYSLSLHQRGLEFGYSMDLAPDGKMAALVKSIPTGSPSLIASMPADAYLALGSRLNLKASSTLIEPVLGAFDSIQPNLGAILKDFMREAAELYGDDYAMAFVPSQASGLTIVGAHRLIGRSETVYERFVNRINGLRAVQSMRRQDPRFGFVYEKSAGTLAGISYQTLRLDFTEPENATNERREQMAFVREILTCHIARKNGVEYWALGTGAKNRLMGLLEESTPSFRSSPAWRVMTSSWGQYAKNGLVYFSLTELLRELVTLAKRMDNDNSMLSMHEGLLARLPKDGGIYAMTGVARNSITMRGLVSRGEIQAIAQLVIMYLGFDKAAIEE